MASIAVFFSACVNNTSSQQNSVVASTSESETSTEVSNYVLANIVDSIISANPDLSLIHI